MAFGFDLASSLLPPHDHTDGRCSTYYNGIFVQGLLKGGTTWEQMSASLLRPVTASASTGSTSRKIQNPSRIYAKRLDFLREFGCRRPISRIAGRRIQVAMKGSIGNRVNASEEGVNSLEQEALVQDSLSVGASGLEATINGLSKWFVSGLFSVIVLWRHDPESLWAAMGAVLNALLSIQLKKMLNQERPFPTSRSDPGMPSSHSQTILFAVIFVNLSMVEWYGLNALTVILGGSAFILGCYFSWLRVSQQLHTVSQVVVGGLVGFTFSIFWFWCWNTFVFNYFVSSLWVRIVVILGSIGFCSGFIVHVCRTWFVDER